MTPFTPVSDIKWPTKPGIYISEWRRSSPPHDRIQNVIEIETTAVGDLVISVTGVEHAFPLKGFYTFDDTRAFHDLWFTGPLDLAAMVAADRLMTEPDA